MDLVHEERTLEHFVDHLVLNIKHKDSLQVVRHCQTMGGITYCHFLFFFRGTICFREWQTPLIYGIIFGPLLLCCQQVYLFFAHQGFVDPQYRCDVLETDDIL